MAGLNASLLALVAAGTLVGVGWIAIHVLRQGLNFVSAGGNPRNVAGVHDALWNIGKGAALIFGAGGIAAFLAATIKFS